MSQSLSINANTARGDGARERSKSFAAARKHSGRVRLFKRGIVIGSAAGIGLLIAVTVTDPFSNMPANVTVASAALSGTKITMELPKMNGFRKDGKPYQVRARSGIQDIRNPKVIELSEVEARIHVENDNVVNVIAPRGILDSGADLMKLMTNKTEESITLKDTSGLTVILRSAEVNMKSGNLVSQDPVTVLMPGGTIRSESMDVSDGGKSIVFNGNVRSLFKSSESESGPEAN